jgi:hypothetical protein
MGWADRVEAWCGRRPGLCVVVGCVAAYLCCHVLIAAASKLLPGGQ